MTKYKIYHNCYPVNTIPENLQEDYCHNARQRAITGTLVGEYDTAEQAVEHLSQCEKNYAEEIHPLDLAMAVGRYLCHVWCAEQWEYDDTGCPETVITLAVQDNAPLETSLRKAGRVMY